MSRRRSCAVALAVGATIVLAASAAAAPARISIRVRPTIVAPGGLVRVSGNADGCPRGDVVMALSRAFAGPGFAGLGGISARVRAGGAFSGVGRVRRHARAGRYRITARCGGGNLGVSAILRVR
jgi:hypothetical protein